MQPNIIAPSTPFTVTFFIPVNTDSNTYYVRAVIYDALTGEILATENLTRQTTNTRLFSARLQAPGDSSSTGRKIVAVATAYTDSGYTTKSPDYQDQAEVFLVKPQPTIFGGGGYGPDYGKIREIIQEEAKKSEERAAKASKPAQVKQKEAKAPEMRWDAVLGAIGALQREVNRIPKDLVDLGELDASFAALLRAIQDKEVTPETDISPILEKMDALQIALDGMEDRIISAMQTALDNSKDTIMNDVVPMLKGMIETAKFTLELPKEVTAKAEVREPVKSFNFDDIIPKPNE